MKSRLFFLLFLTISSLPLLSFFTGTDYVRLEIKPSETDAGLRDFNGSHLVIYDKNAKQGKLLLFMPGTGGVANKGPEAFHQTVVEQGYRLISIAYIDTPAVAQVCRGTNLSSDSNCADEFRMKRMYGKATSFSLISDDSKDAIVNRLVKLLKYLDKNDKGGNWGMYLNNDTPKWSEIAVCGQSQGGGMAEYLGKHEMVYRVISFSGGWDFSAKGRIANWYGTDNVTPPDAWYGTYNVNEDAAKIIAQTYDALKIPKDHIHALDLPVRQNMKAHVEGIANPAYKNIWVDMLGKGN